MKWETGLMESDITVVSVVENDPGLTELMVRSVLKYTPFVPNFIFCDNTNGKNIRRLKQALKNVDVGRYTIISHTPELVGGSNRHGIGLNEAIKHSKTKYTAVIESDVVVLCNDWWKINASCMAKGSKKVEHTYHACFFIFETKYLEGMDWRPGKNDGDRRDNKNYTKYDVGWKICNYIRQDYVEPIIFVDCKSGGGKVFDSSFQSDEFHDINGNLIASHYGRGSNINGKAQRKGFKPNTEQLKEWKQKVEGLLK